MRSAVGPDHRSACGNRLARPGEARWQTARLSAAIDCAFNACTIPAHGQKQNTWAPKVNRGPRDTESHTTAVCGGMAESDWQRLCCGHSTR